MSATVETIAGVGRGAGGGAVGAGVVAVAADASGASQPVAKTASASRQPASQPATIGRPPRQSTAATCSSEPTEGSAAPTAPQFARSRERSASQPFAAAPSTSP